jgi:mono/diheme cytochrome c family protein
MLRSKLQWASVAMLVVALGALPSEAQKKKSVYDGVYTADQAKRGVATYNANCSMCHGESMQGGGGAPAAAGPEFIFSWGGKSGGELLQYLKENMPPGAAGSLTDQRYADIMAAIFKTSEFPEGTAEITPENAGEIEISKEKPSGK